MYPELFQDRTFCLWVFQSLVLSKAKPRGTISPHQTLWNYYVITKSRQAGGVEIFPYWKSIPTKACSVLLWWSRTNCSWFYFNSPFSQALSTLQTEPPLQWTQEIPSLQEVSRCGADALGLPIVLLQTLPVELTVVFKIFLTPFSLDVFDHVILQEFPQQLDCLFASYLRPKVLTVPQKLVQPVHSFCGCEAMLIALETTAMFP